MQLSNPSSKGYGKNILQIMAYGSEISFDVRHSTGSNEDKNIQIKEMLEKNRWYDYVFNARFCTKDDAKNGCDGFVKVWERKSGKEPIYSATGPNTVSDNLDFKFNLYKYNWHCTPDGPGYKGKENDARIDFNWCQNTTNGGKPRNPTNDTGTRYMFFDTFLVGDENSSLQEIAPQWFETEPVDPVYPVDPDAPEIPEICKTIQCFISVPIQMQPE
jgi:hypothetical protein